MITLPDEVIDAFEAGFELELEQALSNFRGAPSTSRSRFRRDKLRFTGAVQERGQALRDPPPVPVGGDDDDLKPRRMHGVFRMRGMPTPGHSTTELSVRRSAPACGAARR